MTAKNGVGVTVVGHNMEKRTLVKGFGPRGSYMRNVTYIGTEIISISQLVGLLEASASCQQFIKYECHHSVIMHNGDPYAWWVSRDLTNMTYWGGASPVDSYKCACGVTKTCANRSKGCNCDANDQVWREDSGLLTEKAHLPVLKLVGIFAKIGIAVIFTCLKTFILVNKIRNSKARRFSSPKHFFF